MTKLIRRLSVDTVLFALACVCFIYALLISSVRSELPYNQWNTSLMSNNKTMALACCQSLRLQLPNTDKRRCSPLISTTSDNNLCGVQGISICNMDSLIIGLTWCAPEPFMDEWLTIKEFEDDCKQQKGVLVDPIQNVNLNQKLCSFKNTKLPDLVPSGEPNTKDETPPAEPGTYNHALVDYAFTRALACCNAAKGPLSDASNEYKCEMKKEITFGDVFKDQCYSTLTLQSQALAESASGPLAKRSKALEPSEKTKQVCDNAFLYGKTYLYGFCSLNFDQIADVATLDFKEACKAAGGTDLDPLYGACQWDINKPAPDPKKP